jgi:hypothetical protein
MSTPIWGTNTLTSLSNRYLMPYITDVVFVSSPLTFRWKARNKVVIQGGLWIEVPWMYAKPNSGGWYSGPEILTTIPFDVVQDGSLPWAQLYNNVTVDGLTLNQADSDQKAMDYLTAQFEMAKLDWLDSLAYGFWSDGTNPKEMVGLYATVDNGTVATSYAGVTRSTNTWLNSQVDSSTTTMSISALNSLFGNCTTGGRAPTLISGTRANYNRYQNLNQSMVLFPTAPGLRDEQFAAAGFTHQVFNQVPWLVDDHMATSGTDSSYGNLFFLNEEYFSFVVGRGGNFVIEDFVKPPNQDAMTAIMKLYCQLVCTNPARQGKFTALAA